MKYAVHIVYDSCPGNPAKEDEFFPPMVVSYGRDMRDYGLDGTCPTLPEAVVRKHWREMLECIVQGWEPGAHGQRIWHTYAPTWKGLMAFARSEYDTHGYPLWEVLADAYAEVVDGAYPSDRLEMLRNAYEWLGMTAIVESSSGYCQGDYLEALVVATPEWVEKTGIQPEYVKKSLEACFNEYAAWAWGDVFGYVVADYDPGGGPRPDEYWGDVPVIYQEYATFPGTDHDSCWGYYGDDHEASGLKEDALSALQHVLQGDEEERAERSYWEARDVVTEE